MDKAPATTLSGVVEKLIQSQWPTEPDKAEIHVEGGDELFRELRIENKLTNEKGEEVRLKPGAKVDITVAVKPEEVPGNSLQRQIVDAS